MRNVREILCLAIGAALVLTVGCGDASEDEPEGYLDDMECPRLEMDSFEDCTVEGTESSTRLHLDSNEDIQKICNSDCKKAPNVGVEFTEKVTDLRVLKGIEQVTAFVIRDATELETLEGLEDLKKVESGVKMRNAPKLESLAPLASLEEVGQKLSIYGGAGSLPIKNLEGLESLRRVETNLYLDDLRQLESVDELESLERVGDYLRIKGNENLPQCEAEEAVEDVEVDAENVDISDNAPCD